MKIAPVYHHCISLQLLFWDIPHFWTIQITYWLYIPSLLYRAVYHDIFNTNNVWWRWFFLWLKIASLAKWRQSPLILQVSLELTRDSGRAELNSYGFIMLDPKKQKNWEQAELLVAHGREPLRNFYSMLCSSKYMGMCWNDWRDLKFRWFHIDSLITNAWDLLQIFYL